MGNQGLRLGAAGAIGFASARTGLPEQSAAPFGGGGGHRLRHGADESAWETKGFV